MQLFQAAAYWREGENPAASWPERVRVRLQRGERGAYGNRPTALSPALVVFVLDMSGSMGEALPGGKAKIDTVKEALRLAATQMVQGSLRNRQIRPRYRVAMIGYSDEVYDLLKGVQPIDHIAKMGIPKLPVIHRKADTAKAFRYVRQLLESDIAGWPVQNGNATGSPEDYPAPLVVHITSGERDLDEQAARAVQQIEVADGCVLLGHLVVSDRLPRPKDVSSWQGYSFEDDLHNPILNLDRLLSQHTQESFQDV